MMATGKAGNERGKRGFKSREIKKKKKEINLKWQAIGGLPRCRRQRDGETRGQTKWSSPRPARSSRPCTASPPLPQVARAALPPASQTGSPALAAACCVCVWGGWVGDIVNSCMCINPIMGESQANISFCGSAYAPRSQCRAGTGNTGHHNFWQCDKRSKQPPQASTAT